MVIIEQMKTGWTQNLTYIVGDETSHEALVVDPHADLDGVVSRAKGRGLSITGIVNTHGHRDHTLGNAGLVKLTGARVLQHVDGPGPADGRVRDGDTLDLGRVGLTVLHTPGHTPDSICLIVEGAIFTGDTLFIGECGRVDLPGGSPEEMYNSLLVKLRSLPDDLEVYPGHDYGPVPHDSLGHQKATNYTLKLRPREEFLRFILEP